MNKRLVIPILSTGIFMSPVTWATDFPDAGIDTARSAARFVLTLSEEFINRQPEVLRDQLREHFCPGRTWTEDPNEGWNAEPECTKTERTVTSPLLYQPDTKIGRSSPHHDGDVTDERRGAQICETVSENSCSDFFQERIKDAHFGEVPWKAEGRPTDFQNGQTKAQWQGKVEVQEVHTRMISLDLKPIWPSTTSWQQTQTEYESANRIRAGAAAPEQPISIGEVESLSDDGKGFPAESFFDMNVEVDLDLNMDGTRDFILVTSSMIGEHDKDQYSDNDLDIIGDFPLIIQGYNLASFPPTVVYMHNATVWAVPMYNKAEISEGNLQQGHVGWLRLAGHGIDFGPTADEEWAWDNRDDKKRKSSRAANGIQLFNKLIEKLPISPINPVEVQVFEKEPPRCKLYVLQDHKRNGSQIFTINPNPDNFEVEPLSKIYTGLDIEGLATHPSNDMIYGTSGNDSERPGYLYSFDVNTGKLTELGPTGFGDVPSIDFHPDGTLWGWAKGKGLITIDIGPPVKAIMVKEFPDVLVEDITWNNAGTHIYASDNTNLLIYDHTNQTAKVACRNLPGETEALEMLPDGSLLLGIHGEKKILQFQALNLETCEIVFDLEIPTDATINDVEGIAWPINLCSQP